MALTPKNWENFPSTNTPITAEALEDLETRMGAYVDAQVSRRGSLMFSVQATGASGSFRVPSSKTIARVGLTCVTAPSGENLVVDLLVNGVSRASLSIAPGVTTEDSEAPNYNVVSGDRITVNVTTLGATTGVVQVDFV